MSDDRWIDDIFGKLDKEHETREKEQAYTLEQRRQFLAGCDGFFESIKETVGAAVDAFNARLKSRNGGEATLISASGGDGVVYLTHPLCDLQVSLDREKELVQASGQGIPSKSFQVWHAREDWREWELRDVAVRGQTSSIVRNIPQRLLGAMFDRIAR